MDCFLDRDLVQGPYFLFRRKSPFKILCSPGLGSIHVQETRNFGTPANPMILLKARVLMGISFYSNRKALH